MCSYEVRPVFLDVIVIVVVTDVIDVTKNVLFRNFLGLNQFLWRVLQSTYFCGYIRRKSEIYLDLL